MSNYENGEERGRLIAGLRELADFLEGNPQVPVPWQADVIAFPDSASDAEMFAQVDAIAELIGVTARTGGTSAGHYRAVRNFGPVQYRMVAIPNSAPGDEDEEAE